MKAALMQGNTVMIERCTNECSSKTCCIIF